MESVHYYWHEGEWNVPRILRVIPMPFAQIICQIPIAAGQGDRIVWTESSTGDFSTKSAWEAIRQASPRRQLLADVWHRSCGQLSQFSCGGFFKIESQWTSECNKRGSVFHLNVSAVRQRRQFPICSLRAQQCKACGSTLLPFLGSASVIRGASPICIILEVQRHLRTLYAARTLTSTQWKGDLHRAAIMGFIFRRQVPRAPSIVRWHAPSPSWFKLNTDGSSLGNPGLAGAAGIIRDSAGHVHLAYQFALGTGTSVLAELTAVWRGMELALTHGLAPLVVEVDATTVISLLQSRASGKWELLVADVQHVFREANGAADHLAKEAASLQLTRVLHHDDITGTLRGIICLDRQGVLTFAEGDDVSRLGPVAFSRRVCGLLWHNGHKTWHNVNAVWYRYFSLIVKGLQPSESYSCDGGGSGGPSFGNGGNQVACFGDLYGAADTLSLPRISHSTAFGASGGSMAVSGKALFTASQWQELERQKVIHKYIMASIRVPPQLLLPTSSTTSPLPALSQSNTEFW
ncbi:UNVERIFIED_CONTAM: putative ribonuclease H protein [Sesamum angustifolium]|uniref:Ribonuclease H protein n=1 Tax=Sesamum angustifolium TaxID=2727405 RepID=A0AAW2LI61_9LAMI